MLSEQPVLGTCGMIACADYLTAQADVQIPGYFAAPGVPLQLDLLVHCVVVERPWEDGKGHAQANTSNPQTHIFVGAADPCFAGLALDW